MHSVLRISTATAVLTLDKDEILKAEENATHELDSVSNIRKLLHPEHEDQERLKLLNAAEKLMHREVFRVLITK